MEKLKTFPKIIITLTSVSLNIPIMPPYFPSTPSLSIAVSVLVPAGWEDPGTLSNRQIKLYVYRTLAECLYLLPVLMWRVTLLLQGLPHWLGEAGIRLLGLQIFLRPLWSHAHLATRITNLTNHQGEYDTCMLETWWVLQPFNIILLILAGQVECNWGKQKLPGHLHAELGFVCLFV